MNGNEKSEFSSQAPQESHPEYSSYHLPENGRPQQQAVPRYPFKRRSFSNENISVNVDANMNGNSNGASDNWRFSRKRHSFQNLSTLQNKGNGEGCSSNNGTTTTTAATPAAPSTKIIRGNGSSSLGLRRRYSFESFELKKDSSSGSGSGSWPGGRRGPVFSHNHHQYSSLPLLTKRLSCRVLPTATTLEPIPPSPTAPEDADENEESNQDNICGNLNGNNEDTNASNNSPQDEGHKKLPSEKCAKDEKSNSTKTFDTSDEVAGEGVSTNADAVVTLDKIISSPGETVNFLIDELFYEPVLLFNYFRRGCGWLVDTTQLWCQIYNRRCGGGDNGNTEGKAVSKSLINPNDETRPQASISKISPFPSLLQSLTTFSSSAAKTALPLFNAFCKALHNIRSSAPWTMDCLQHYYNHECLLNKIFSKSWRRRKDGWDVDRKDDGDDNECAEKCANDDEQERKKKDGKDQMTNYASDDDVDKNAENDKKVSQAQRQSRGSNCTSGGGSTLTSKLSFVRKKLLRSFPFPDGKGNLLIVFSVVTVMTLLLLMLTMMTIFNFSASTGHILSSSSKILEKSFSGGEAFGKLDGTNLAMMTDIIRTPNKQTIDTTRIYRDGCTINRKSEKYFHHVYSFTSSSKPLPPPPPSSSYSPMSPTSTCLYLLEHKKSGNMEECKAEKKEDAIENIFSQHSSSSLCLHCIANEKCASSSSVGGVDDDDVGGVDIKKKKSTVDEPQEEKDKEEKNEEKKRQVEFGGMEEAHYHHHNHQKPKQQKRVQEEQQHQRRNKIVLKEPTLVPLAQLESDSQEQAVWVVLSVLFTIVSSSCALTLFLVFIHKSYTPRNGIGCSSSSVCVANSNAHHCNQCRYNSQHLIPSAFVQSSNHSPSTWLPEQQRNHNQHSCCERPLKAVPTNSVCNSILVGGRDYGWGSGIDQGYHNAPPPLRPTWSDPRRVKVTRPSNTRSGSGGSTTGKRVNLAGRQLLQQPTTEKPIQREQDQYCRRHHHHCRCQEKEEESQKKTFSSFPLFPRESAGIVAEVNAGPFQDKKGKCNFVSETEVVRSCCDGSRINSFSTCFSRCHCYYCCCCSDSSSYRNDNGGRRTTKNCSDKSCGNGNNIHDNDDYDDVKQKSEQAGEPPKNNIANGDHDLYEDYDKWKSATSVGGDSTSVATRYCYDATNSRRKTSNGGGSGLLAIASENISSKKQTPCRSSYLSEDTGTTVHGSRDILDNVNDKNGKDGRDDEQEKHQQWHYTHEEQRPRQHYYNSHHYHQVDSAVTLVDREKDSSSSSVSCTSPYYYYRYYSPHQQHNQQKEQPCNNNQPHQKNKYFLNKFCQPDKVLFPIFWTALVVDFNFPNCSPFLHALVVVVTIKLINLYHHYRYFTQLWGGLHQCDETAAGAAAAGNSNEKRDKEKCEFFNGKHYRDNHHHHHHHHHHHQQNLFGDSTHDNRNEKRTKEGEEKEKREKVESKIGSEAAVTTWACSQYHHHHHHHQQHPQKLPISSTCSQYFPSEKGEGYRSGSSFQPLKGTPVTTRNSLKEQLREGFAKEASQSEQQQCLHFLLLFNPQKNNLLRGSSKITILLWLYFILIRRLGSFLAFSTACITTISSSSYTTYLYFPLSSHFSFCFTHLLGIIGLLFGQLCIQRLGCHQWNNWICQLTCFNNNDSEKRNSGENNEVHKGYSQNCQYCCSTCSCCFRGNSSKTTPFPPSTPSAALYACPTDYSYSTRNNVKISDTSNKGEEEKYPCNRNSSSSPCVVIPPCSSSSKVHHQEYHSSHHFNLDENFISQRARVQSETSSSTRENKERRAVSSTTSSSSLSSSSSVAALLEDEQNGGVKDEQCACSSAFSSKSRNNKGNDAKSRNDFEYSRLERSNDDNDNLNNKKQEWCWCYCCNSCSSSRSTVNNTGIILGESSCAIPSESCRKGARENYTFHDRTRRDGREVYYSTTPPPTSLSVPSTTCFCINGNHHHQSKNENCLPLHPSRNSGDLSSSSKVKSSKRIAFLLHNDNQKDASGSGSSSCVAGKTNSKRSSLRQNNLWNGNNGNGSSGCSLIGSIGGSSGRRKKYFQTVRQEDEEKTKEANKSCNKNCGLLSLPSSSLLRADVINYPTNGKITRGADSCATAASSSSRKSKEKVGEVVGGLVPETIPFSESFRRKINGISGKASSYSINSKSSSDEDDDDDSDSTQLGSLSRSSSSSGSLVLGADELPEECRNKVENVLTTSTRQTRERLETNDDNNNSNHNHNSNDDNDHVGNSRSRSTETTSLSRQEKTEEGKGNREVIFVSSSTSTSASSTSSSSSSSPNPTTSAELESSSNTANNPVKAGGTGEEGAVIFQKDNCQSRNVTRVDDEEDLSYFLYYNHVNNNNSARRTGSGGGGLSSVGSRANDAGSSGSDTISMRTGGLVFRPSSCLKSEKSISFRDDEDCKQSTSSGGKFVNLHEHKSVPSVTSPLQGILSKTNHMNCKGVSKKSTGSSGSSSSSSGKIIKNVGISSATATIITGGESGRKDSIGGGGGGAAINRVPTPPPSLTSPHTSILAGLGGSGGGRERKTYISHKFITTSGITGGAGGSSISSRNITGEVALSNDDGGRISPGDNAAVEVSSQSDALSSHNTSTATITILPNYPNDSTSCTSTTSLTTSPPSSSSVSALTGTTVIIDGGDNQIKGSDDGDNSKSINTESQQPPSPPSSSLQVSQSPSSLPTSTSTSSSQQQSSNANAASFLFSSTGTTTKRLFRSGSQCCVNSSSSSSPILHFQQSSTPPQQLLNNNHHNSPQQQHMNNQQGSIEKYLSSKMRRTSLPAALPAQRTAIHHGSAGVDTALLYEAHGLVTEMLLDQAALPANIVAGLKALATLLKPTPTSSIHYQSPRPKPVPLTLSIDPDYTSDIDEIPYTGEKISSIPKGKKGVSANILRRMSTSTWTTTTSATGMPTLEPQPHTRRRRSASFRSSALGVSHRRFSQHELSSTASQLLEHGQRKTVCSLHPLSPSDLTHLSALAASTGFPPSGGNTIKSASASVSAAGSNRSSPASTPIPSPIPSPVPSRDPSPCNHQRASGSRQRGSLTTQQDLYGGSAEYIGPTSSSSNNGNGGGSGGGLFFQQRTSPSASTGNLLSLNNNSKDSSSPSSSITVLGGPGGVVLGGNGGLVEGDSLGLLSGKNPDEDNCSTTSTLGDGPGPPDNSSGNSNSLRLSPVTFTLQEPPDINEPYFRPEEDRENVITTSDGIRFDLQSIALDPLLCRLHEWDYPIFDLERSTRTQILSHMCYKVFLETGLFETFRIPIKEFITYFHALELGYRDKPYHNRMHAGDVLHGVYYLTSQAIPGFQMVPADPETPSASDICGQRAWFNVEEASYGIMGANFTSLELMALYVAAAMHDYDHPGRTNAFLVSTHAKEAILYNDRSVLENHHAAAAWSLLLSNDDCNFLKYLDKAEFKRFRYLVIEAILATDLKRHFEIVAEFNSKVNEDDSPGIDWTQEDDRLLVMEIAIKLADINGPCKVHDIHVQWTYRIAEEFYEQGDEEAELGLPISPFMDRDHPQLARLQESFINHLVAPLCKACAEAGILPGYWIEDQEDMEELDNGDNGGGANTGDDGVEQDATTADDLSIATTSCQETDNDENDESSYSDDNPTNFCSRVSAGFVGGGSTCRRRIFCLQTKHLQDNHRHWMGVIKEENKKKEELITTVKTESVAISTEDPMETIEEENNTPHSLNRSFSFEKEDSKL